MPRGIPNSPRLPDIPDDETIDAQGGLLGPAVDENVDDEVDAGPQMPDEATLKAARQYEALAAERDRGGEPVFRQQTVQRTVQRTAIREDLPRSRKRHGIHAVDKFYLDPSIIPDGTSYEWKRSTIFGKNDVYYDREMLEQGWRAVPAKRHPFLMPDGYEGPIIRDGLILMERAIELTNEAKQELAAAAFDQVHTKMQQLGEAPPGTMQRQNGSKGAMVEVNRSYGGGDIPA